MVAPAARFLIAMMNPRLLIGAAALLIASGIFADTGLDGL
jgi:hypothetical protein